MKNSSMFVVVAVFLLGSLAIGTAADPPQSSAEANAVGPKMLLLEGLAPGRHFIRVQVSADGSFKADVIQPVTLGGGSSPPINTTPSPTSIQQIREATQAVGEYPEKTQHSQALGIIYQAAAESVKQGRMTEAKARAQLVQFRNQLWGDNASQWAAWSQVADAASISAVASGVETAAGALPARSQAARGDLLKKVVEMFSNGKMAELIKMIMMFIQVFGGV